MQALVCGQSSLVSELITRNGHAITMHYQVKRKPFAVDVAVRGLANDAYLLVAELRLAGELASGGGAAAQPGRAVESVTGRPLLEYVGHPHGAGFRLECMVHALSTQHEGQAFVLSISVRDRSSGAPLVPAVAPVCTQPITVISKVSVLRNLMHNKKKAQAVLSGGPSGGSASSGASMTPSKKRNCLGVMVPGPGVADEDNAAAPARPPAKATKTSGRTRRPTARYAAAIADDDDDNDYDNDNDDDNDNDNDNGNGNDDDGSDDSDADSRADSGEADSAASPASTANDECSDASYGAAVSAPASQRPPYRRRPRGAAASHGAELPGDATAMLFAAVQDMQAQQAHQQRLLEQLLTRLPAALAPTAASAAPHRPHSAFVPFRAAGLPAMPPPAMAMATAAPSSLSLTSLSSSSSVRSPASAGGSPHERAHLRSGSAAVATRPCSAVSSSTSTSTSTPAQMRSFEQLFLQMARAYAGMAADERAGALHAAAALAAYQTPALHELAQALPTALLDTLEHVGDSHGSTGFGLYNNSSSDHNDDDDDDIANAGDVVSLASPSALSLSATATATATATAASANAAAVLLLPTPAGERELLTESDGFAAFFEAAATVEPAW